MEILFLIILIAFIVFSRIIIQLIADNAKRGFPLLIQVFMFVPGVSFAAAVFLALTKGYVGILTALLLWVIIGGSYFALAYARIN
jgi:hypothetical protein